MNHQTKLNSCKTYVIFLLLSEPRNPRQRIITIPRNESRSILRKPFVRSCHWMDSIVKNAPPSAKLIENREIFYPVSCPGIAAEPHQDILGAKIQPTLLAHFAIISHKHSWVNPNLTELNPNLTLTWQVLAKYAGSVCWIIILRYLCPLLSFSTSLIASQGVVEYRRRGEAGVKVIILGKGGGRGGGVELPSLLLYSLALASRA